MIAWLSNSVSPTARARIVRMLYYGWLLLTSWLRCVAHVDLTKFSACPLSNSHTYLIQKGQNFIYIYTDMKSYMFIPCARQDELSTRVRTPWPLHHKRCRTATLALNKLKHYPDGNSILWASPGGQFPDRSDSQMSVGSICWRPRAASHSGVKAPVQLQFSGMKSTLAGIPLTKALGENRRFSLQIMFTSCSLNSAIVLYSRSKFAHICFCSIHCQWHWPNCCKDNRFRDINAINKTGTVHAAGLMGWAWPQSLHKPSFHRD